MPPLLHPRSPGVHASPADQEGKISLRLRYLFPPKKAGRGNLQPRTTRSVSSEWVAGTTVADNTVAPEPGQP